MVTIKDIAKAAGVSIATVSYVLNNDPRVKRETADKVLRVSQELNYVGNSFARSLKTKKTHTVLTIIPDFSGPIHTEIIANIHKTLKEHNYQMLVCVGDIAEEILSMQYTDGVIVLDPKVSAGLLKKLASAGVKVLDTREAYDEHDKVIVSRIDYMSPSKALTKMILDEGYTKIGFMHGSLQSIDNSKRFSGFWNVLQEKHIDPFCILYGNFVEEEGYAAIKNM